MTCTKTVTRASHVLNVKTQEWYDRSVRSWTVIAIDIEGNQIGDAQYCWNKTGLRMARLDAVTQTAVKQYKDSPTEFAQIDKAFGLGGRQ